MILFFFFLFNRSKIDLSHQMSDTRQLRDYRGYMMRAYYYHSMKQDRKTYVTSHYRENNRRY